MLEVMRCVLGAVEGELCVLAVLEAIRRVLLFMLDAVEGELRLLEVLENALCATLYAGASGRWARFAGGVGGAGGDAPCATLYAGD